LDDSTATVIGAPQSPARQDDLSAAGADRPDRALRVLVVDDDDALRALMSLALTDEGYDVLTASSAAAALALLEDETVDLVVTDVNMPGGASGLDLLLAVRQNGSAVPFIIVTGSGAEISARSATMLRVVAIIDKPFPISQFRALVARTLAAA
jgi:DNA-binding NtrC family response regulator